MKVFKSIKVDVDNKITIYNDRYQIINPRTKYKRIDYCQRNKYIYYFIFLFCN